MALARNLVRLGVGSLSLARQRLELASLDIEEELLRFGLLLARALVTALMMALALCAAAASIVIHFWDGARMAAVLGVTGFFTLATLLMVWQLFIAVRDKPRFLGATLAELEKDSEALRAQP